MNEARARELLARERERIERTLATLLEPSDDGERGFDPADDASRLHDRELEEGMAGDLRRELEAIARAEERLEAGTYGLSVESGEPIPDHRLEAIPWAERTADEEERRARRV
jgi:DnaK suppressor protein